MHKRHCVYMDTRYLTEVNCQPGKGDKLPLYSIIFTQELCILFNMKFCPCHG